MLTRHASADLARIDEGASIVERVRSVIAQGLAQGRTDVQFAASALATSARSLQRKLHLHGTSFSQVLLDEKRAFAVERLARPGTSTTELAFLLGYSERSAFHRAFRRWTGKTPREISGSAEP